VGAQGAVIGPLDAGCDDVKHVVAKKTLSSPSWRTTLAYCGEQWHLARPSR
jgi:hypothetical protein